MKENTIKLTIIAIVIAGILVAIGLFIINKIQIIEVTVMILLLISGPYPFYESRRLKKIEQIERHLPDFLRDISVSIKFGMTLSASISKASTGNYGKLTPAIKKMATEIDWGVSASDALELFAKRVNTPLVKRATAIVIKSSAAGGDISDVISVTADNIKELQLIAEGRKAEMSTYKAVIFVAFAVFLVTVVILNSVFLPAMMEQAAPADKEMADAPVVAGPTLAQIKEVQMIYIGAAIVQGFGDGILLGVIEGGKIVSGMRNSFIMVLLGYLVLTML